MGLTGRQWFVSLQVLAILNKASMNINQCTGICIDSFSYYSRPYLLWEEWWVTWQVLLWFGYGLSHKSSHGRILALSFTTQRWYGNFKWQGLVGGPGVKGAQSSEGIKGTLVRPSALWRWAVLRPDPCTALWLPVLTCDLFFHICSSHCNINHKVLARGKPILVLALESLELGAVFLIFLKPFSQVWWCIPIYPALGRWRKEDT